MTLCAGSCTIALGSPSSIRARACWSFCHEMRLSPQGSCRSALRRSAGPCRPCLQYTTCSQEKQGALFPLRLTLGETALLGTARGPNRNPLAKPGNRPSWSTTTSCSSGAVGGVPHQNDDGEGTRATDDSVASDFPLVNELPWETAGGTFASGDPYPGAPWQSYDAPGGGFPGSDFDDDCLPLMSDELADCVAKLGIDRHLAEREEAICALWRHARGTQSRAEEVAALPGGISLIISLVQCESAPASEAAAGLMREIVAVDDARPAALAAGALEEIAGLLLRGAPLGARKQAVTFLQIVSSDSCQLEKIVNLGLLPTMVTMLSSPHDSERESAAEVVANLAATSEGPTVLAEMGALHELAALLMDEDKATVPARQLARAALVSICRDKYLRPSVVEEGLVIVPLIGASAYKSFRPLLQSPPIVPDGVRRVVNLAPPSETTFGAGKLLLGLSLPKDLPGGADGAEVDRETLREMEGRIRQQFLARLGVLEKQPRAAQSSSLPSPSAGRATSAGAEEGQAPDGSVGDDGEAYMDKFTVMPHWDGIPRLVLILGLENAEVAARAAEAVYEFAGGGAEHRAAVRNAGGVPHLLRLLGSGDERATAAAADAVGRLALSPDVRRSIESHGAVDALVALLCADSAPPVVKEKVACALQRLCVDDEAGKMRENVAPGLAEMLQAEKMDEAARTEAENVLDEISQKSTTREKIVAAGGVPPLVAMLSVGTIGERKQAANVLTHLARSESFADILLAEGVGKAATSALELLAEFEDGITPPENDLLDRIGRLVTRLAGSEKHRRQLATDQLTALLTAALRLRCSTEANPDVVLKVRVHDPLAEALLKLKREDPEVTVSVTIPQLVGEIGVEEPLPARERAALQLHHLAEEGRPEFLNAIAATGGTFPLVDLLCAGSSVASDASLAILSRLGDNDENHAILLRAGAPEALQKLIRVRVSEDTDQFKLAMTLLRKLPV